MKGYSHMILYFFYRGCGDLVSILLKSPIKIREYRPPIGPHLSPHVPISSPLVPGIPRGGEMWSFAIIGLIQWIYTPLYLLPATYSLPEVIFLCSKRVI